MTPPLRWLTAIMLTWALAAQAAAPRAAAALHKKARARMKSLDFEAALPLLERLRDLPPEEGFQAIVHVDLAVTYVNLGRWDDARKSFDDALALQPDLVLPPSSSPKVRRLFDEAREARAARLAPPPPVVPPPAAPPLVEPPGPGPVVIEPARPRRISLPVIALAGAGVGGVAFGLVAAVQSQQASRELISALHPTAEVEALLARRRTWAALTWVGYGVGAACLAASAVVFLLSDRADLPSAALLVSPDGASVALSGHF